MVTLDQRALDAEALAGMLRDAHDASERVAAEEGCQVEWEHLWDIEPIPFNPTLLGFAEDACRAVSGAYLSMPSRRQAIELDGVLIDGRADVLYRHHRLDGITSGHRLKVVGR